MSELRAYTVVGMKRFKCAFFLIDGQWYFIKRANLEEREATLSSIPGIERIRRDNKISLTFNDSFIIDWDSREYVKIKPDLDLVY